MRSKSLTGFVLFLVLLCASVQAWAQTPPGTSESSGDIATPQAASLSALKGGSQSIIPSLFYSPQEMLQIQLAVNSYIKFSSGNDASLTRQESDFLNQLAAIFGKKQTKHSAYYTYPQFFLKSLVYHSENDWTLWLNDMRITPTRRQVGDVEVLSITNTNIQVEWTPPSMDRVNEIWLKTPNERVEVDQVRGRVLFTLKPNQTFSAYKMDILEGRVMPVTIGIAEEQPEPGVTQGIQLEEAQPGQEQEQPLIAPSILKGEMPIDPNNREGLSGLINSYKKLEQK